MGDILDFLVYKPFSWLLITLYDFTHSYVFAIVLFALITKIVLLYFTAKGKLGTMRTQRLQPKLLEIQKAYAKDKEKLNAETMKLYQAEGVSPMSGCLWMLLPFPVLIMLYTVIRQPLTRLMNFEGTPETVVQFLIDLFTSKGVSLPEIKPSDAFAQLHLAQIVHENFQMVQSATEQVIRDIDFTFLGANMTLIPPMPWVELSWVFLIPLISAGTAYLQFWISTKMTKMPQTSQTKYMALLGPGMSLWIGYTLPAVMSVYWIANNVFSIIQDYFLNLHYTKVLDAEDAHKADLEARRKAAEEKQREEDRLRRAERMAQKKGGKGKYKVKKNPGKTQ